MEVSTPRASDLLAVRSRVSWGAIAAGAMIATAIYFVLTLLGIALGAEVAVRGATTHLGSGAALYAILTLLVSMFFGGWATSRLAVGETKLEAVLYGIILWGALFLGLVWLFSVGVRTGFGAMVGLTSGASALAEAGAKSGSSDAGVVDALRRRYDTELGGETFVSDLKKAGLSDEQAKKAQEEVRGAIGRLRDDPKNATRDMARDAANNPEVREAGSEVAQGARQATWWTLLGILTSMAAVIFGSLVGVGEVLQPVPILGVRRTTTTPRTHA